MTNLDYYWMTNPEWIKYENKRFVLREDAPPEAQESYKKYLEQRKEAEQRGSR